jgi:hypothetical protein
VMNESNEVKLAILISLRLTMLPSD